MKDTIYPEIEKYIHCSLIIIADRLLLDLEMIKPADLTRIDVRSRMDYRQSEITAKGLYLRFSRNCMNRRRSASIPISDRG